MSAANSTVQAPQIAFNSGVVSLSNVAVASITAAMINPGSTNTNSVYPRTKVKRLTQTWKLNMLWHEFVEVAVWLLDNCKGGYLTDQLPALDGPNTRVSVLLSITDPTEATHFNMRWVDGE